MNRKWRKRWGIERTSRNTNSAPGKEAEEDIRSHLLFGQVNRGPEDYLFAGHDGRLPSPDYVSQLFGKLVTRSKLKPIRFHDLRHSFGTIWGQRIPSPVLKAWMGHSSITTTEGYVHPNDDAFRRVLTDALRKQEEHAGEESAN
jgi:integrase